MPFRVSTPVKASRVNCDPWSLLKIAGLPWWRKASSRQSTQNTASLLLLIRQLRTLRLTQSMIATRVAKPRASRIGVISVLQT
jgi:hypothetical protein